MIQRKINRLTAADTTVSFCEGSAAATTSITNFAPTVATIKSKLVIVHNFNILGNTPITGVRLNFEAIREALEQHTYLLANATFAYAGSLTPVDSILMAQAKLNKGYLERLSKTKCLEECQRIHQLAAAHAADILPFGASAADITDTEALIILYTAAIDDSREAIISRSSAKHQADLTLSNVMDNLLTIQLDSMSNTLRYTNNEWWLQYRMAREVIDLGSTFTKLRVTVTDQKSFPLKNAHVTLLQSGSTVYTRKTDAAGKATISRINPDVYDLQVTKNGYLSFEETGIEFSAGDEPGRTVAITALNSIAIREGNIPSPGVANIDLGGINGTSLTMITFEVTGSPMRVYAAASPTDAAGSVFLDLPIGSTTRNAEELAALLGLNETNSYMNLENTGVVVGHYKITFTNLNP